MAGLDLPTKLRRGLGQGRVLGDEELAARLGAYDQDRDGHLSKAELRRFLSEGNVGGPWFCDMLTHTIWKKSQQAFDRDVATLAVPLLARVLHYAMARTQRPGRRYVITPEAVRGEEPRLDIHRRPVDETYADLSAPRPRAGVPDGRRPAAPRAPGPSVSGRSGPRAPSARGRGPGPAPRGRPAASGRAPARPEGGRTGRSGPRRPGGRPRS